VAKDVLELKKEGKTGSFISWQEKGTSLTGRLNYAKEKKVKHFLQKGDVSDRRGLFTRSHVFKREDSRHAAAEEKGILSQRKGFMRKGENRCKGGRGRESNLPYSRKRTSRSV